ncbi:MAG TPA: XdhC/CoxI family protein [Planctomycetota bacterium]|nr:XdhC/CoxI family protein [Planctomycetota bacterium]
MEIFREIVSLLDSGRRGALATVIGSTGSTPGKEAARMLVRDDGSTAGTIGGGCTEAEVWALAREVIATDRPLRRSFKLTPRAAEEEGLACGGIVEVFIEPLGSPVVLVFGAGHIGRILVPLLTLAGFHTKVIDDREQFANRTAFPDAGEIILSDFESSFEKVVVTSSSCLVIVTRGHRSDQAVLSRAIRTPASYVGLIGSRPKFARLSRILLKEGASRESLERVHCPIGLDIGARSPEEIALAIAAELVAHRRRAYIKGKDPSRLPLREAEDLEGIEAGDSRGSLS